jgi:glycosyltransferase involved in cell wall biosynthesis
MITYFSRIWKRKTLIMRYCVAGFAATFTDLVLLYLFTSKLHFHYLISASFAFLIAFFVSFLLQKLYAFREHEEHIIGRQIVWYFLLAVINLGVNDLIMWLLVSGIHLWYMLAQVITVMVIATENFFFYRYLIFPQGKALSDTHVEGTPRLLIITQEVDERGTVLGFMHGWIAEFAKKAPSITVICLREGAHSLPANVKVLSLGKEKGYGRIVYLARFFYFSLHYLGSYDAVFVHMNQEYVLLAGWFWWLMGKPVTLWRNHHAGNWLTRIAVALSTKVFCTSHFSYTARFKKTVFMPVGVDTEVFAPKADVARVPRSVLFFSRIAPVKRPDVFVEACRILSNKGIAYTASVYGSPLPKDNAFYEKLKRSAPKEVRFHQAIANAEASAVYSAHQIYVNLSPQGMYDKIIFEALSCECDVLASNPNLKNDVDPGCVLDVVDAHCVAERIERALAAYDPLRARSLREKVERTQSLHCLSDKLMKEIEAIC